MGVTQEILTKRKRIADYIIKFAIREAGVEGISDELRDGITNEILGCIEKKSPKMNIFEIIEMYAKRIVDDRAKQAVL